MKKSMAASLGAIAVSLALLGSGAALAQNKVTVGIVTALTGPLAAPGVFQMNGFKLAEEEINSGGGITVGDRKYTLEIKVYDTRGNPSDGASAMQRLATVDKVAVVLGELSSGVAAAISPIAQDYSLPFILTVPTGPNLTEQNNPYVFRVNANNQQLNLALADFVIKQGWAPLSYIAWNNDAGRGGVIGMNELLPGAKSGYTGYFNVGEVDFSSHITNIRNSKSQAVMLFMDEEPGSLAIKQIHDAGVKVNMIGTLAMGSDRFLKRLDAKTLNGIVQYNAFPPNATTPRIRNFSQRYKAKFGEEAHGFAAQSYDGLMVAVAAMQKAGSVSDGKAIREALSAIEHQGVIGTIKFDRKGQANPAVYVTQWCANGSRSILYPDSAKAPCGSG